VVELVDLMQEQVMVLQQMIIEVLLLQQIADLVVVLVQMVVLDKVDMVDRVLF
jgi:hypothetical protein|tara:strand:+ start:517 stop:675 length:159 start_codon:yes stop_codon:yes gene_type:complete